VLIVQSYPLKPHYCASSMLGFPFFLLLVPRYLYKFREFLGPHDVRRGCFIDEDLESQVGAWCVVLHSRR